MKYLKFIPYIIIAVALILLIFISVQVGRIASFMSESSRTITQYDTWKTSLVVWQGQATQLINFLLNNQVKK